MSGRSLYPYASVLLTPLLGAYGFKVSGKQHVPVRGPLLLAANHATMIDPFFVGFAAYPRRELWYMGKAELFRIPVLSWVLRGLKSLPLERKRADVGAMRRAGGLLEAGEAVLLFPEGTRVRPGERRPAKAGLGFLAEAYGVPVLPARVFGADAFPRPGCAPAVAFGRPLRYGEAGEGAGRSGHAAFAERVLSAVYGLERPS